MAEKKKIHTSTEVKSRWNKANLDRVVFTVHKGNRKLIQDFAKESGYLSTSEYIKDLIKFDMNLRDL